MWVDRAIREGDGSAALGGAKTAARATATIDTTKKKGKRKKKGKKETKEEIRFVESPPMTTTRA